MLLNYFKLVGFLPSDDNESIIYQERSIEPLQLAQDTLLNGEPIQVQLDRNLKIFSTNKRTFINSTCTTFTTRSIILSNYCWRCIT